MSHSLPDKKNTTTNELTMENQCIWTSVMPRYMSHLEAQLTSDAIHWTEYVNRRLVGAPRLSISCGFTAESAGSMHVSPSNWSAVKSILDASTSKPTTLYVSLCGTTNIDYNHIIYNLHKLSYPFLSLYI